MRQILTATAVCATLALGAVACQRRPAAYTIGAAGPLRDPSGVMNQRGIDLAIEEINRSGGINGVPLRVIVRDDNSDGPTAAGIAKEFVANPQIISVVGHATSGAMVAAARVYDGNIAAVATSPSSPDLTGISKWTFRMISSDSMNGGALARFASNLSSGLGRPARAGIIYDNTAYGRGLADAFRRNFRGKVLNYDPVAATQNVEPYVAYYKMKKPDVVFVATMDALGLAMLREARRQSLRTTFIGGDGWEGTVVDTAASQGVYVGTPFTAQSSDTAVQRFVTAFRSKFKMLPDSRAALAYDATKLTAAAISEVGTDRKAVRDYIAGLNDSRAYRGVTGAVSFASTGDPVGDKFKVLRIRDGALVQEGAR